MLKYTKEKINLKLDTGIKFDFDSCKNNAGGKTNIELSLQTKENKKQKLNFFIKTSFDLREKQQYRDLALYNFSNIIIEKMPEKLQNFVKEIGMARTFSTKKGIDLSFLLKVQERSIKSFTIAKDSILQNTCSLDNPSKKNIMCITAEKMDSRFFVGTVGNPVDLSGFVGGSKSIGSGVTQILANIALEKWQKECNFLLSFQGLYNSVGLSIKTKIPEMHHVSNTYSFVLEPIQVSKIVLWKWIKNSIEKRYLDIFLKNIGIYTVFNFECGKLTFTFIFSIKDFVQVNIKRDSGITASIPRFEMKQTLLGK